MASLTDCGHFGRMRPFWQIVAILAEYGQFGRMWPVWPIVAILAEYGHFGRLWPFWPIVAYYGYYGHFGVIWPFWPSMAIWAYYGYFGLIGHISKKISKKLCTNMDLFFEDNAISIFRGKYGFSAVRCAHTPKSIFSHEIWKFALSHEK